MSLAISEAAGIFGPMLRNNFWLSGTLAITLFAFSAVATSTPPTKSAKKSKKEVQKLMEGLEIEEIKVGTGKEAKSGTTVSVHYTGKLKNGTKFDSSVDRGIPFEFPLGAGRVIQGWDKGVAGMKEGGKRKLTIAPALGYGSQAVGPIPPNSTLVFEVELLAVK